MGSKIDPFAELLGKVSDERIAEMAGVRVSTVVAYRARLGIGLPDPDQGTDQPDPDENLAPEESDTFDLDDLDVEALPAPGCVRVLTSTWVDPWVNGRARRLGRKDVFTGADAAWLWEHHRDLVEPFPPVKE